MEGEAMLTSPEHSRLEFCSFAGQILSDSICAILGFVGIFVVSAIHVARVIRWKTRNWKSSTYAASKLMTLIDPVLSTSSHSSIRSVSTNSPYFLKHSYETRDTS